MKLGELSTLQHGVSGEVFVLDEKTLVVKNFNYDGTAPDAYFMVGTEGTPGQTEESKMAFLADPFEGVHYYTTDQEVPVLGAAVDKEIVLTLPPNMKVNEIKCYKLLLQKTPFALLIYVSYITSAILGF